MPMRRSSGARGRPSLAVDLQEFGWDAATIATVRHSTLPWPEPLRREFSIEAVPLASRRWGHRDALSLFGQYAAHLAFLHFLSMEDAQFDPGDWAVSAARGRDCRLFRLRARTIIGGSGDISAPGLLQSIADCLGIEPLESLEASWSGPHAVYGEVSRRLRADVAADLTWFRRSAIGWVDSPGADLIGAMPSQPVRIRFTAPATVGVLRRLAAMTALELVVLGGEKASPLKPYSALDDLQRFSGVPGRGSESERSERIAERLRGRAAILVIIDAHRFDPASRAVVRMLADALEDVSWAVEAAAADLIDETTVATALPSRQFVLARTLERAHGLERLAATIEPAMRSQWLEDLVESEAFDAFLDEGALPPLPQPEALSTIGEPHLSYLSALALIGERLPRSLAEELLGSLSASVALQALELAGISTLANGTFAFESAAVRQALIEHLPSDARAEILTAAARLWAKHDELVDAAMLYWRADASDEAVACLEKLAPAADESVLARPDLDRNLLLSSPRFAESVCRRLVDSGRYRTALAALERLEPESRRLVSAAIDRRLGNYDRALQTLTEVEAPSFAGELLAAELFRLTGDEMRAEERLALAGELAQSAGERFRLGCERAILAIDQDRRPAKEWDSEGLRPHALARVRSYLALHDRDYETAVAEATTAVDSAEWITERIDAALDLMYARFLAGEWEEARHAARKGLALVEETEGDRAGGGFLFTLGYLCADEGRWREAEIHIDRLRRFYRHSGDERRLIEVDLLEAQLSLGRLDFAEARRRADRVLLECGAREIRQAARLILDELDWIEGSLPMARSSEETSCMELLERHRVVASRASSRVQPHLRDGFARSLVEWEIQRLRGGVASLPSATTRSEELRLIRSALAVARRTQDDSVLRPLAAVAAALDLALPDLTRADGHDRSRELALLQRLATVEFPPPPDAFADLSWRMISRNRLGHWTETGSMQPLAKEELEALLVELPQHWVEAGERRWLYVEGFEEWSAETRRAVAELVRVRFEHRNFGRILEQDEAVVADRPRASDASIVGESAVIRDLLGRIDLVAGRDIPVCIEGESGTGKELIARAIHAGSPRRGQRFTAVNCAALPEQLIESELFGHVRGAFTGADRDRTGLIEASDGGTLFLDEIGDMPLTAQAKLLRFLQEGEIRRVGDTVARKADARIVAATNRRLEQAVDEGIFRQDLYYRIKVVGIDVPPLRERGGDVLRLAKHFVGVEQDRQGGGPGKLAPDVEAVFLSYSWPGNVRELQNTIRGAHAMAGQARQIEVDHLPDRIRGVVVATRQTGTFYDELNRFRRTLVERSLAEAGGNQNRAAKMLGISRQSLAYQVRELGIMVRKERRSQK